MCTSSLRSSPCQKAGRCQGGVGRARGRGDRGVPGSQQAVGLGPPCPRLGRAGKWPRAGQGWLPARAASPRPVPSVSRACPGHCPRPPASWAGWHRGAHEGWWLWGGSLSSRKGLGVLTAPALPWVGAAGQAGTVLCPLLAQALPPTGAASPPQQGEGLGMRSGGLGAPVGTGSLPPTPLPPARLAHLPPSPLEHLSPGEFGSVSQICCLPAGDPADYPSQYTQITHPSLPRLPIPAPA